MSIYTPNTNGYCTTNVKSVQMNPMNQFMHSVRRIEMSTHSFVHSCGLQCVHTDVGTDVDKDSVAVS